MAQNLSVPLAFVALLHLANEKVSSTFKISHFKLILWQEGKFIVRKKKKI